jgi:hypothetical protein
MSAERHPRHWQSLREPDVRAESSECPSAGRCLQILQASGGGAACSALCNPSQRCARLRNSEQGRQADIHKARTPPSRRSPDNLVYFCPRDTEALHQTHDDQVQLTRE